jgi:hypothetical protein
MKIALLAFHFPPDPAVGSVRPASWARWLGANHEVVVITRAMPGGHEPRHHGYRVVQTRSPAVVVLSRLQERRVASRVREAGTARPPSPSRPRRAQPPTGAFTYRMPCLYDAWGPAAYRVLCHERPDVVIATHSPYISLLTAASYAARNPSVACWLDYRDMWTFGHASTGLPALSLIEQRLERWAVSRATLVTSCSEGFCARLAAAVPGATPRLIYNSPGERDQNPTRTPPIVHRGRVTIAYTGNLYPWQDATPLWRMIRNLHDSQRLTPDDLQIDIVSRLPGAIVQSAAAAGVAQYVRYHGSVSREQALEMQRAADVLLLLDSGDPAADGVLHAKVFEYLATDRPILLLGSGPSSELYRMIAAHGRLFSVADLQAVLEGHGGVPTGDPVDYATVAKSQLTDCLHLLEGQRHARAA